MMRGALGKLVFSSRRSFKVTGVIQVVLSPWNTSLLLFGSSAILCREAKPIGFQGRKEQKKGRKEEKKNERKGRKGRKEIIAFLYYWRRFFPDLPADDGRGGTCLISLGRAQFFIAPLSKIKTSERNVLAFRG